MARRWLVVIGIVAGLLSVGMVLVNLFTGDPWLAVVSAACAAIYFSVVAKRPKGDKENRAGRGLG